MPGAGELVGPTRGLTPYLVQWLKEQRSSGKEKVFKSLRVRMGEGARGQRSHLCGVPAGDVHAGTPGGCPRGDVHVRTHGGCPRRDM